MAILTAHGKVFTFLFDGDRRHHWCIWIYIHLLRLLFRLWSLGRLWFIIIRGRLNKACWHVVFVFFEAFHYVWLKGLCASLFEVKTAALGRSHFFKVDFCGRIKIKLFARFSFMHVEILHILTHKIKLFFLAISRTGRIFLFVSHWINFEHLKPISL